MAQAATEARQGGVLSERMEKKSSRETCLVVREEIKNVEKRERKQDGRERKRATDKQREGVREEESVSVGGKAGEEEGRGE